MNIENSNHRYYSIVLGNGVNALGLVRGFAQANIKTIVCSNEKCLAGFSRHCKYKLSPKPFEQSDDAIQFLINLSKNENGRGVIFPADDDWLEFLIKNWTILEPYFIPSMDFIKAKIGFDKKSMYELSNKIKLSVPKYSYFKNINYEDICNIIVFPCILKIPIPINYLRDIGINQKVFVLRSKVDFERIYKQFKEKNIVDYPIIIQEFIKGETINLYTLSCYSNKKGEIIASTVGYKIHQWPPQAGTITSGKVLLSYDPRVFDYSQKLLEKLKFRGISNIEFKYDKERNEFFIMEINCRSGKWNTNALFSGVNLAKIAFYDSINSDSYSLNISTPLIGNSSFIWIHELGELYFLLSKLKTPVSLIKSIKELKGKKKFAVLSIKDCLPFICESFYMLSRFIKLFLKNIF